MKFTPDCDLNGFLDFRPDGVHSVSLHDFEEVEVIEGVTIQVLRCKRCGRLSYGWWRGGIADRPINYEVEDEDS